MSSPTLVELDQTISDAQSILAHKSAWKAQHAKVKSAFDEKQLRLEELEGELKGCEEEVRSLDQKVQKSLFSSEKHRKLLQERQSELFLLEREHEDTLKKLDDLDAKRKKSARRMKKLKKADGRLDEALSAKQDRIYRDDDKAAADLDDFADDIREREDDIEDVDATIDIGEAAHELLGLVFDRLHSALKYGTADVFFGGIVGGLVTGAKHRKLDEAAYILEEAQHAIALFQSRLSSIDLRVDIQTQLSDFEYFADYLGGFIADIAIQSKIKKAHSRVKESREDVSEVLDLLLEERNEILGEIAKLEDERDLFVEEWGPPTA